jgi:CubicO group peptidase (beta-lactamase class C family)
MFFCAALIRPNSQIAYVHNMKKILKYLLYAVLTILLVVIIYVSVYFPPVMAGMVAKTVCSCMYVSGRSQESIVEKELQVFPGLDKTDIEVNSSDSTVSASMLWHTSKAIYRKGLGCTLLAEMDDEAIRKQRILLPARPSNNQDSIPWPTGNVNAASDFAGVDRGLVEKAIQEAFEDEDPENPIFTHGVIAVYKGKIIGEKYAPGLDQNSILMGWSMTKSITNGLIGILVKEGKLDIASPAPVSEWQNDDRRKITINNLMQASSGLVWSESYFNPSSDFHTMFIRRDDKAAYAASRELESEPGTEFEYSSGTTNILSRMIRQTVGDSAYYKFPYEKLFYKIGMNGALMEPDASGTFVTSSYGYARARDWARLGLLYLNDGVWDGERILPEGWVKYSTTPAPAATRREYGAQIWLNQGATNGDPETLEYPGLPTEAIIFDGFERNYVVIIPSKELVVVRLGVTHNKNFHLDRLVNGVVEALPR